MNAQKLISRGGPFCLLGALVLAQGHAMSEDPARSGPAVQLVLHGNTPTLSWSPDSTRVVVNASYTYFGFDASIEQHKDQLGVWVVDARSGLSTRVGTDQGYHPLWLDDRNVAWGHSVYEAGAAGLYRSPADRSEVTRVGTMEGVNHTLLAKEGGVLYCSGFPEDAGWTRVDLQSGQPAKVDGVTDGSWTPPRAHFVDQCLQRVGPVSLSRGFERGKQRIFVVRDGKRTILTGEPYQYGVGDPWLPDAHKGAVRACLSPDGHRVAWFVGGSDGGYALRIGTVPAP